MVSGETDRGSWYRGGMIVRTLDEREQLVAFTAFGEDKCKQCAALLVDDVVQVNFTPESREFGDKWYTDLRMTSVQVVGVAVPREQKGGE